MLLEPEVLEWFFNDCFVKYSLLHASSACEPAVSHNHAFLDRRCVICRAWAVERPRRQLWIYHVELCSRHRPQIVRLLQMFLSWPTTSWLSTVTACRQRRPPAVMQASSWSSPPLTARWRTRSSWSPSSVRRLRATALLRRQWALYLTWWCHFFRQHCCVQVLNLLCCSSFCSVLVPFSAMATDSRWKYSLDGAVIRVSAQNNHHVTPITQVLSPGSPRCTSFESEPTFNQLQLGAVVGLLCSPPYEAALSIPPRPSVCLPVRLSRAPYILEIRKPWKLLI